MSLEAAQQRHKAIGRNDPCPCGSGKKYKKCHQAEDDQVINAELKRLKEAADLSAAAAAADKESEEKAAASKTGSAKAGSSKDASKGKVSATSAGGKRGGKSGGQTASRSAKVDKAQSLPRRGAV